MPDPSCNPYLALAVMLAAGLEGIEQSLQPMPGTTRNVYEMSDRERNELSIKSLPGNLGEALANMEQDKLLYNTLGEHIFEHFLAAKRKEWNFYISQVHKWEIDNYLTDY